MNSKYLMTACAILLGITGIVLTFFPQEISIAVNSIDADPIVLQIIGALYFGFAMLNWTAKDNLIGGIYGRPIAIGNFTHFMIGAFALLKFAVRNSTTTIWILAIVYILFAVAFGYIFTHHPPKNN